MKNKIKDYEIFIKYLIMENIKNYLLISQLRSEISDLQKRVDKNE